MYFVDLRKDYDCRYYGLPTFTILKKFFLMSYILQETASGYLSHCIFYPTEGQCSCAFPQPFYLTNLSYGKIYIDY